MDNNNNLKINSFQRKTEALEQITGMARLALSNCVQPDVARIIQGILDTAEITNQLYGSNADMIELTSSVISTSAKTNPYIKSVQELLKGL